MTPLGPILPSILLLTEASSPGVKRPELETGLSPQFRVEFTNAFNHKRFSYACLYSAQRNNV